MLTTIIVILVVLIAAVLIYAATRPDDFIVSRSASINALPEAIFPEINDFRRWSVWSPGRFGSSSRSISVICAAKLVQEITPSRIRRKTDRT